MAIHNVSILTHWYNFKNKQELGNGLNVLNA